VAGFDVLVVGSAVEHHVTLGGGFAGISVVGDFVSIKVEGAVADLDVAAEFVDGAVLFLLSGLDADIDSALNLGNGGRLGGVGCLGERIRKGCGRGGGTL
jgi:hypothetical protein